MPSADDSAVPNDLSISQLEQIHHDAAIFQRAYIPYPLFNVEARISELPDILNGLTPDDPQRANIELIIRMYRENLLPRRIGEFTFVQDGKECQIEDVHANSPFWMEVCIVHTSILLRWMAFTDIYLKGQGMQMAQMAIPSEPNNNIITV